VSAVATAETVIENSETRDEGTAVSKAAAAQKTSEKPETPVKVNGYIIVSLNVFS